MSPASRAKPPIPRAAGERLLDFIAPRPGSLPSRLGLGAYRRRGADRRPFPILWLNDLRRTPRLARDRHASRRWLRLLGAAAVPASVAVASVRERLRLPAPVSIAIAGIAPLGAIAATRPRSRTRYIVAGAA
jgi:hypothetical protein